MDMSSYNQELNRIVEELNRAAGGQPKPAPDLTGSASLDELLSLAARQNATDVLLVAGSPVTMRVHGVLTPGAGPALSPEDVRALVLPTVDQRAYAELQRNKSVDLGFERENIGRFRINVHHQRGTLAASIRLLPSRVPNLASLHLPPTLHQLIGRRQGLVLVTGPTGCGKSTTLAAMIEEINSGRRDHIVTIEDPVEYQHFNRQSLIEQIEVGRDTPDFLNALRSILRQNPNVIMLGEMRDPETISTVLTAAETGHLVFSTLHTNDATQSIGRILDAFPSGFQAQIRQQLSLALLAVIAQQLVPGADGRTRYPALEVLVGTDAVRNLIRRGEDHQLRLQLSTGRTDGMRTMEQSLAELVREGRITRESALAHCFRPDDLRALIS